MIFNSKEFEYLRRFVYGLIFVILVMGLIILRLILTDVFGPFTRTQPRVALNSSARQVPSSPTPSPVPSTAPIPPNVSVTPQTTPSNTGNSSANGNSVTSGKTVAQQSAANIQRLQMESEAQLAKAREMNRIMSQETVKIQRNAIQSRNSDKGAPSSRPTTVVMMQPAPNPVPQSSQPVLSGLSADEITNIAKQIGDAQAQIDKYRAKAKSENALVLIYRQQYQALKQQADYLFSQYDKYSSAATDAQNHANTLSQQANELASRHAWWGNPDELSAKSNYFQHQADALNYQANQIRENAYKIQSEYNADFSKSIFHEDNAKYANQQIQYYQSQITYLNGQLHPK